MAELLIAGDWVSREPTLEVRSPYDGRVVDTVPVACLEDVEASRVPELLRWCAAEALRQAGEVLTMDAVPAGTGCLGFTVPEPCGVVVAITPFNYPALLV